MNNIDEKINNDIARGKFILWLWTLPVGEDGSRWDFPMKDLKRFARRGDLKRYIRELPWKTNEEGNKNKYCEVFDAYYDGYNKGRANKFLGSGMINSLVF